MIDLIKKNGSLLPGVLDTLKLLKEKNNIIAEIKVVILASIIAVFDLI